MDGLRTTISSYNIINYLLPGCLFAVIADAVTDYQFIQEDIIVGVFLYYFIGLVISRLGSLVVEPILKGVGIVNFVPYNQYVEASAVDTKIAMLSETNNMYRTLCTLFPLLYLFVLFDRHVQKFPWLVDKSYYIVAVLLFVMFLCAYRKQTIYIVKRVKKVIEEKQARVDAEDTN